MWDSPATLSETNGLDFWLRINSVKNPIISTKSIIEILPCLPAGRGYGLRMTKMNSHAFFREKQFKSWKYRPERKINISREELGHL